MAMPGFTAEHSLYDATRTYRAASTPTPARGQIAAAFACYGENGTYANEGQYALCNGNQICTCQNGTLRPWR